MQYSALVALAGFTAAALASAYELQPVAEGFDKPVQVIHGAVDTATLYVTEHRGRIVKVQPDGTKTTYLDLSARVLQEGEAGLLSFVFDKNYAGNGRVYVAYNAKQPRLALVLELIENGHATRLLTIPKRFSNHNGGQLAYGPDGYLYLSTGDGGCANDPDKNGQNKNSLLGKMLRFDVGAGTLGIPSDNPFVQGGGRKEIFAWGLRNVWRFSFDRQTGKLFGGDVGQDRLEEIDVIERGGNYGWNTMEGTRCFNPATNCVKTGLQLPIYEYPRSDGVSITGGFVYRGKALPALQGVYVYGDYGSGKIWGLHYDQTTKKTGANELLVSTGGPVAAFGETYDGELLVAAYDTGVVSLLK